MSGTVVPDSTWCRVTRMSPCHEWMMWNPALTDSIGAAVGTTISAHAAGPQVWFAGPSGIATGSPA